MQSLYKSRARESRRNFIIGSVAGETDSNQFCNWSCGLADNDSNLHPGFLHLSLCAADESTVLLQPGPCLASVSMQTATQG